MENKTWFQIWEMLYLQNVLAIIDFTILDLRTCFMDFSTAEILCRLVLLQGGCFCCRCFCSCCFPSSSVLQDLAKQQNHDRFKFDDEHVTPCSEYAAIEDNYGGALCADSNLSFSEGTGYRRMIRYSAIFHKSIVPKSRKSMKFEKP